MHCTQCFVRSSRVLHSGMHRRSETSTDRACSNCQQCGMHAHMHAPTFGNVNIESRLIKGVGFTSASPFTFPGHFAAPQSGRHERRLRRIPPQAAAQNVHMDLKVRDASRQNGPRRVHDGYRWQLCRLSAARAMWLRRSTNNAATFGPLPATHAL